MAKSRSQLGFTLIEVLLAMALLMLLILTAVLSMITSTRIGSDSKRPIKMQSMRTWTGGK